MSYYSKNKFVFTDHALYRIKERLGLNENDNFKIKDIVINIIEKCCYQFEDKNYIYFETHKKGFFLVVDKKSKSIITATKISIEKQLKLIEGI